MSAEEPLLDLGNGSFQGSQFCRRTSLGHLDAITIGSTGMLRVLCNIRW